MNEEEINRSLGLDIPENEIQNQNNELGEFANQQMENTKEQMNPQISEDNEFFNSLEQREEPEPYTQWASDVNPLLKLGYSSLNSIKSHFGNDDWKKYKWYNEPNQEFIYTIGELIDKGDAGGVEELIEENPEVAAESLPESPLQDEAEQMLDSDKRNDEVNNEVVEDAIKKPGRFFNDVFEQYIKKQEDEENKQYGVTGPEEEVIEESVTEEPEPEINEAAYDPNGSFYVDGHRPTIKDLANGKISRDRLRDYFRKESMKNLGTLQEMGIAISNKYHPESLPEYLQREGVSMSRGDIGRLAWAAGSRKAYTSKMLSILSVLDDEEIKDNKLVRTLYKSLGKETMKNYKKEHKLKTINSEEMNKYLNNVKADYLSKLSENKADDSIEQKNEEWRDKIRSELSMDLEAPDEVVEDLTEEDIEDVERMLNDANELLFGESEFKGTTREDLDNQADRDAGELGYNLPQERYEDSGEWNEEDEEWYNNWTDRQNRQLIPWSNEVGPARNVHPDNSNEKYMGDVYPITDAVIVDKILPKDKKDRKYKFAKWLLKEGGMSDGAIEKSIKEISDKSITRENPKLENDNKAVKSGTSTRDNSFATGSSSGVRGVLNGKFKNSDDKDSSDNRSIASATGNESKTEIEKNKASFAGTAGDRKLNSHLASTMGQIGLSSQKGGGKINSGKTALPTGESKTAASGGTSLKAAQKEKTDINAYGIIERIKMLSKNWPVDEKGWKNSGTKYLPAKFYVKDDTIEMSLLSTGKKRKNILSWMKDSNTVKQITQILNKAQGE